VVGVVSDHRFRSPFAEPFPFVFFRALPDRAASHPRGIPSSFVVRVRPDTPRSFERVLHERLTAVAPGWRATVTLLEERHASSILEVKRRYAFYGLVGGFLVIMVALGLTGVMWQSVTERTREIGIRRAVGAAAGGVRKQLVGESLALATVAILVGVALMAQSAVLGMFPTVEPAVYAAGAAAAALVRYAVVALAALYPGLLATHVQPADALHHD
jgi:putative ABC transport system permease protein